MMTKREVNRMFLLNFQRRNQTVRNKEYVMTKQLLRCGTAIGALASEAEHAQSKADFLNKMNVALKEANEVLYWLVVLKETVYLFPAKFRSIHNDAEKLVRILLSIVKTTKLNFKK